MHLCGRLIVLLWFACLTGNSWCCAQARSSVAGEESLENAIAFPGAEGFGAMATGGRGGKVIIVNNLDDSGPGSLRSAVERKEARIVVFAISGTIHLQSPLGIRGDVTIAGQSAPGDGICIADQPVSIVGDNVIMRFMRIRLGDKFQRQAGMKAGSGHDDALSISRRKHVIIDHCSFSWSTDEVISMYGGDSSTVQWCLIYEPLNYSYHFEAGDTDFERHGYGGIWGGTHLTAHHNAFAHCISRTPRFNGTRLGAKVEFVDYYNNVVYNWQSNNVYGGEGGLYAVRNNYFKAGPGTASKVKGRIVNPTRNDEVGFGKFFVEGNYSEGLPAVTTNNLLGVHIGNGKQPFDADSILLHILPKQAIGQAQPATEAYNEVLTHAGASLRRDTLDQRVLDDIRMGKGNFIDVQGGHPHGTPFEKTASAWPLLKAQAALADRDKDGMPDTWETTHQLNPDDAGDAARHSLSKAYTNIEVYLNSLVTFYP